VPWSALEAFVAVADRSGFTAAAQSLGVTPSSLSQAVSKLEKRMGIALFARTTRAVALTDEGRALYAQVAPALRQARNAVGELSGASDRVRGTLRLTMGRVAVAHVLHPILPALLEAHPDLRVEVSVDDRFVDIVAQGFDAGVRVSGAIEPDLVAVRLTRPFRFVIVGAPSYLERRGLPERPSDLLSHDCVLWRLPTTGAIFRWRLQKGRRTEDVNVTGRITCDDASLLLDHARLGLGLAFVDELGAEHHVASGELEIVLADWAPKVPGFFLYFPRSARELPKLRAFVDVARESLRQREELLSR
jgi:DNA-binding transcriptional LysR family regulator